MKNKGEDKKPKAVTTLAGLEMLVEQTLTVRFGYGDPPVPVEIKVKPITPALAERLRKITRAVQPPWKADRKDYDALDPKYLELRDEANRKARSVTVYYCCPEIAAKKPTLASDNEIHAFVQTLLTESILELIEMRAQIGGMSAVNEEVTQRANFISTPDSES